MLKRKRKVDIAPDELALEQRVDSMMDPKLPDAPGVSPLAESSIDIFRDLSSRKTSVPSGLAGQMATLSKSATTTLIPVLEIEDAATESAVGAIEDQEKAAEVKTSYKPRDFAAPGRHVSKHSRLIFLHNKWLWISVGLLLAAALAIPFSRYMFLGLLIKEPVTIRVVDSKTSAAVSGVTVTIGDASAVTNASGKALLKSPVGTKSMTVAKQYFNTSKQSVFVGFNKKQMSTIKLVATGRQVGVKVVNALSGSAIAGVTIEISGTNARTDAKGLATIFLPAAAAKDKATLTIDGYNTATNIIALGGNLAQNTFKLTPSGKLYFLSDKNGTIDLIKANLDGSDRKVILEGTGKEDAATTSLLAARDWRYLVLKAKRDSASPALYIIDTATDKATQFESGASNLTLIGWYGHSVLYDSLKTSTNAWQSGREVIKSYNADTAQLNLLDQNQAEGTASSFASQSFGNYEVVDNAIVYTTAWTASGGFDISTKTASIRSMQPTGQNKKDLQTFPSLGFGGIRANMFAPNSSYYVVTSASDNAHTYYQYQEGNVTANTNIDQAAFSKSYPTYFLSPSSTQSVWADPANGTKLFIGDNGAKHPKQVGNLSGYTPYGWYGDSFVLLTIGDGNLYIVAPGDAASVKKPYKVGGYFKPAQTYPGYGYGYGGL